MSGLEVAGLILAVYPILVTSLAQYKSINRKRDFFRKRDQHVARLIDALREQQILIESDLELLLRAADLGDDVINDIKAGDCLHLLSANNLKEDVETYMGGRYAQYVLILERSEKALIEIASNLNNLKPGPWRDSGKLSELLTITKTSGYEAGKRLKFSLSKDSLDRQISELDSCTRMLSRLRELGMSIHDQTVQSASRKSAKLVRALYKIRSRARLLYNALSFGWTVSCHNSHSTDLFLQDRLDTIQGMASRKARNTDTIQFQMFLGTEQTSNSGSRLRHDAEVSVHEPEELDEPFARSTTGVKFQIQPQSTHQSPGVEVQNLCMSVQQASSQGKYLRLVIAQQSRLYAAPEPPSSRAIKSSTPNIRLVSLEQILSREPDDQVPTLSLMQRTKLMFILASSFMQLYSTPWMGKQLSKKSIFFLVSETHTQKAEVSRPLLSYSFPDATSASSTSAGSGPSVESVLFELGILIMELWHNKSFESYYKATAPKISVPPPPDSSTQAYYSRLPVAKKWLEDTSEEFIPNVFEAASRCIGCQFVFKSATPFWDEEDFRRSIFDRVVKPLWDNCSAQNRT